MFRPDRGTLRSAGFVVLLAGVFILVNTQVVYAASGNGESGDLLAPLNITSSEGVPINNYELDAEGGGFFAFKSQALAFALSGLFTLIRMLVGLAGWAIEVALRFPLLKILAAPAEKVADAYDTLVVDTLGLKGLLLAWAFVFAAFMIVRGRVGRGLGEIFLTLLIAAFAASAFVRPDYLLAQDGPLGQSQQVGAEVAQQSVNSYNWGGKLASTDPCDGMVGNAEAKCLQREGEGPVSASEVARPIQHSITNALIVKPYMLLQYGRTLDPAKPADRKAYALHLKWISGGYKPETEAPKKQPRPKNDPCRAIKGPAKKYCEAGTGPASGVDGSAPYYADFPLPDEDQQFGMFLSELRESGPVGKSCADYAEKPTWSRVAGAALLLVASLFICGMLLSASIVLLGTQGICAAAAAAGGVTFIAGMLPGPARQSVWKWLSLWGIAVLTLVGVCAFVPFFGIAVDATITNGPDLMVERILLIDVLAIAGAAGHRRLLTGIVSFGRRMAMRMRHAKVGGTQMPGDTSKHGGGLRAFTGGGFGKLGTRQQLMGALTTLFDGTGMPGNPGGMLADATAEARHGLAPLAAAAAAGGIGTRLGAKGAHWLLIGKRPDKEQLAKWRKPTADGDQGPGSPPAGGPGASGSGGPRKPGGPGGPPDRYRDGQGQIVDRASGKVLHDQNTDRTLLSTRAHNRLVRFRGYRILHRGGRAAYGATAGLPATIRQARTVGSRYSQDARQQVRVWGNTVREDGRAWAETGRHVSRVLPENNDDRGGNGPFVSRRLPTTTASGRPRTPAPPTGGGAAPAGAPTAPNRLAGGGNPRPASAAPSRRGPGLAGGGSPRGATRDPHARMQELFRAASEADRLRTERNRQQPTGEGEEE
ncbi:hypothetical protein ACWCP6_28470 [Streptomyces sp. NPDC002004]